MAQHAESTAAAFRATLELFDAGVDLMRQNLRRKYPDATPAEVESRLGSWLRERPGATFGDCAGRVVNQRSHSA